MAVVVAACVAVAAGSISEAQEGTPVKRGVLAGHGHAAYVHRGYGHGHYAAGHGYGHRHGYVKHNVPIEAPSVPACAANSSRPWCLEDAEYPTHEIQHAAEHFFNLLLPLYTDVSNLNTELSLSRPINTLQDETYLCPSSTNYVQPLRVVNTNGHWRVIVNNIKLYTDTLTQTTRVEVCLTPGSACPKVPDCIGSSCLEKSVYHRFLVYDPTDHHFPFAIESFKLPTTCACRLDAH
ncbi:neurotrophin 1-like [Portunus trituberculatus]|uniref:neurotrophin 1-like n=1 Tax=Portunus trituberculatus TaxID=210409 RepID=UPI001E1CDAB8|nr:neurotrophin 1-like [Portunus trituberculatus]